MVLPEKFIETILSAKISERSEVVVGKYIDRNYGGEDMIELFALKLFLKLKGESFNVREKMNEIMMRLGLRGLLRRSNNRTIHNDFVEMQRLAFIEQEKKHQLTMTDEIPCRATYLEMVSVLEGRSDEESLQICKEFVNEWDWGDQGELE